MILFRWATDKLSHLSFSMQVRWKHIGEIIIIGIFIQITFFAALFASSKSPNFSWDELFFYLSIVSSSVWFLVGKSLWEGRWEIKIFHCMFIETYCSLLRTFFNIYVLCSNMVTTIDHQRTIIKKYAVEVLIWTYELKLFFYKKSWILSRDSVPLKHIPVTHKQHSRGEKDIDHLP